VWLEPSSATALESLAADRDVPLARLGETGGPRMVFGEELELAVVEAAAIHEDAIPRMFESGRLAG
jgi:hypothetical protein